MKSINNNVARSVSPFGEHETEKEILIRSPYILHTPYYTSPLNNDMYKCKVQLVLLFVRYP